MSFVNLWIRRKIYGASILAAFLMYSGGRQAYADVKCPGFAPENWSAELVMNAEDDLPIFGERGVAGPDNHPASRIDSVTWTGADGALWLFGGGVKSSGSTQTRNDLWRYDSETKQWTWVSGSHKVNDPGNYDKELQGTLSICPPARSGAQGWVDGTGNLWLYGGATSEGFFLSDLWMYNPVTNLWSFKGGSKQYNVNAVRSELGGFYATNHPGSRADFSTFTDGNGNFYLFGGWVMDKVAGAPRYFNDVWKYSLSTESWAWIHGDETPNSSGLISGIGVSTPFNTPGARCLSASWSDSDGDFWIYGGTGRSIGGQIAALGDMWRYSVLTNQWTLEFGEAAGNSIPDFGTKGVESSSANPGSLFGAIGRQLDDGKFYLFGGVGHTLSGSAYNSLWVFNPDTKYWSWIRGGSTSGKDMFYGSTGSPSNLATPPAISNVAAWLDRNNELVIHGGMNPTDTVPKGMWRFGPDSIVNMLFKEVKEYTPIVLNPENSVLSVDSVSPKGSVVVSGKYVSYTNTMSYNNRVGRDIVTLGLEKSGCPRRTMKAHFYDYVAGNDIQVSNFSTFQKSYVAGMPIRFSMEYTNTPDANAIKATYTYRPGKVGFVPYTIFGDAGNHLVNFKVVSTLGGNQNGYGQSVTVVDKAPVPDEENAWAWIAGSDHIDVAPVYVDKSVETFSGTPGSRNGAVSWTANDGTLWLFGGSTPAGLKNDLWKFNPASNQWTWVAGGTGVNLQATNGGVGVEAPGNNPSSRWQGYSWPDNDGDLWLFGGKGIAEGATGQAFLNDLWKFSVKSNQWTFVRGGLTSNSAGVYNTVVGDLDISSQPGGMAGGSSAVSANGTFWLFGGEGRGNVGTSTGYLNHIWKYYPQANIWSYVGGTKGINSVGIYNGVQSGIHPGGRKNSGFTNFDNKELLIFGGFGYGNQPAGQGLLGDIFAFHIGDNQFRVLSDNDAFNVSPVWGVLGVESAAVKPGGRQSTYVWQKNDGNLGGFGGTVVLDNNSGINEMMRDFWKYNMESNAWTWTGGDQSPSARSFGATLGVQSSSAMPGGRIGATMWTDVDGNVYLYGGIGLNAEETAGVFGDMWKYFPLEQQASVQDWQLWE